MEVFGGKPRIHQIVSHTLLNSYEEKVYVEEASDLSNGADSSRTEHQPEMDFPLYCLALCSVKGLKSLRQCNVGEKDVEGGSVHRRQQSEAEWDQIIVGRDAGKTEGEPRVTRLLHNKILCPGNL